MQTNISQELVRSYTQCRPDGRFADRNRENLRLFRRSLGDRAAARGRTLARSPALWLGALLTKSRLGLVES